MSLEWLVSVGKLFAYIEFIVGGILIIILLFRKRRGKPLPDRLRRSRAYFLFRWLDTLEREMRADGLLWRREGALKQKARK